MKEVETFKVEVNEKACSNDSKKAEDEEIAETENNDSKPQGAFQAPKPANKPNVETSTESKAKEDEGEALSITVNSAAVKQRKKSGLEVKKAKKNLKKNKMEATEDVTGNLFISFFLLSPVLVIAF